MGGPRPSVLYVGASQQPEVELEAVARRGSVVDTIWTSTFQRGRLSTLSEVSRFVGASRLAVPIGTRAAIRKIGSFRMMDLPRLRMRQEPASRINIDPLLRLDMELRLLLLLESN